MNINEDNDDIVVYSVRVFISHDNIYRSRTFSNSNAEEVIEFFFYGKLSDQQADITKYLVKKVAKFKDTDQFAIALKGYEYLDKYSN